MEYIDNTLLRERWLEIEEHTTLTDVARYANLVNGAGKPDSSSVGKALGVNKDCGKYRTRMTLPMAEKLCEAMGFDPIDCGF